MAGKTYYVSGTGNDKNNGLKEGAAFGTLQKAGDLVQAGDTVYVMNGTYTNKYPNILSLDNKNGTADKPIVFKALEGHKPVLAAGSHNWNAIAITGSSYIEIEGLTLKGARDKITLSQALSEKTNLNNPATSGNGINITYRNVDGSKDRSHHITIDGNNVSKFPGSGISAIESDYINIENNTVSGNGWYSPFGTQGISMLHLWDSDNNTETKVVIKNNTVFDNKQLVPWVNVGKITEGHGIMIDRGYTGSDSKANKYDGGILIEDNLVYKNGGSGIQIFKADSEVDVLNNTLYQNGQVIKMPELVISGSDDTNAEGNILFGKGGQPLVGTWNSTGFEIEGNLFYNGITPKNEAVDNITGLNPLFTSPWSGDFSLKANSPAIVGGVALGIID
ncbi:right-handed parallel beta-helix repeat-containing protein [Nostoc sp. XA010]|uniref:right-handed parallel beta-helix repeat-containing protein n=1 Tax=Nostoc sp. XA010 TaxID=2780407 RepID=UPI001E3E11F8|nr:right-handed parallel beta-helix repeat-containing protein [Nostoc sp. XA010]MCC5656610.1 right-handed parallel beta-helix repeat-containing protein [Nostoc sp. XA010]